MLTINHYVPVILDIFRIVMREHPVAVHVEAALEWLCCAQDITGNGVSACYSLRHGWFPPYPETTGYIIPTFFDCAAVYGRPDLRQRALRMADWELDIQHDTGGIPCGLYGTDPSGHFAGVKKGTTSVFNTGQVIFGWCRAYQETGNKRYLEAANAAACFIIDSQDEDGAWRRNLSCGPTSLLRTYKSRVAWSLAELYKLTGENRLAKAAKRALDWTVSQQLSNGYFRHASFNPGQYPLTHTIAYCIEGLLEGGVLLACDEFVIAASRALESLMRRFEIKGYLAATFDSHWHETASYECLTGNAQIARALLRLYEITDDVRYLNTALKINRRLKQTQLLAPLGNVIRGAIKGSHPIWGSRAGHYCRFTYPNWAAKFFIDALLLEERAMAVLEGR